MGSRRSLVGVIRRPLRTGRACGARWQRRHGQVLARPGALAHQADQTVDYRQGADPALAHGGVQRRQVRVPELPGHVAERVGAGEALQRQPLLAHDLGDLVLARLDGRLAALLGEPLADLVARAGALDEREPVPARPGFLRLGGEDLYGVAVVQGVVQRDEAAVDPRADRTVADLRVDRV